VVAHDQVPRGRHFTLNNKLHPHNPRQKSRERVDDKSHIEPEEEMLWQKRKHQSQQETQKDQDKDGNHDGGHANVGKNLGSLQNVLVRYGLRHLIERLVKFRTSRFATEQHPKKEQEG
jgi:hypothetical protein